ETGVQLSTELEVEPGDEFAVTTTVDGRHMRIEAKAVTAGRAGYGRTTVGARITKIGEGDLLAIRRAATREGRCLMRASHPAGARHGRSMPAAAIARPF